MVHFDGSGTVTDTTTEDGPKTTGKSSRARGSVGDSSATSGDGSTSSASMSSQRRAAGTKQGSAAQARMRGY